MLEKLFNAVGMAKHTDGKQHYDSTEGNVIKSVIHTLILPLGLSLAVPVAGILYAIFAVVAYSTIFRAKSRYVFFILKNVSIAVIVIAAWIALIGFVGSLGAAL